MKNAANESRTFTDRQLDWVKVLGPKHAEEVFQRLHEVVKRDVESANEHAYGGSAMDRVKYACQTEDAGDDGFLVIARWTPTPRDPKQTVRYFDLERGRIVVRRGGYDKILHTAKVALRRPRHCLLDVEGHERPMRLWQFSRLALEPLFFPKG